MGKDEARSAIIANKGDCIGRLTHHAIPSGTATCAASLCGPNLRHAVTGETCMRCQRSFFLNSASEMLDCNSLPLNSTFQAYISARPAQLADGP